MATSPGKGRTGQTARTDKTASRPSNGTTNGKPAAMAGQNGGDHLIDQMKQQHRDIESMLTQPGGTDNLEDVVTRLADAWLPHTLVEEQILLPALQQAGATEPALAEANVRRDLVKVLLADLRQDPEAADAAAKFAVLSDEIESLIEVEERPSDGVLALAETHNVDLDALRGQVEERRARFQSNAEGESSKALEPTSLRVPISRAPWQNEEYSSMPYDSNVRERDSRGRFESDDDRRGGSRSRGNDRERDEYGRFTSDDDDRGYRSRSSRDYDDDYRRSGSSGGGPGRDENGRFTSGGYSSRSSRYDEDDRRGGARGEGRGWYGDSEGHAEAAREGWDERRGYRSRSARYEDDDRRSGMSDRGQGGWFGDPRGHSEASREGWEHRRGDGGGYRASRYDEDERRGARGEGRGWYGDSEGHAEAAREGWDERRGSSSRSSRYEDDDRRGGGRGHGGWFGDPEGHSEASRRGWEDRR